MLADQPAFPVCIAGALIFDIAVFQNPHFGAEFVVVVQ